MCIRVLMLSPCFVLLRVPFSTPLPFSSVSPCVRRSWRTKTRTGESVTGRAEYRAYLEMLFLDPNRDYKQARMEEYRVTQIMERLRSLGPWEVKPWTEEAVSPIVGPRDVDPNRVDHWGSEQRRLGSSCSGNHLVVSPTRKTRVLDPFAGNKTCRPCGPPDDPPGLPAADRTMGDLLAQRHQAEDACWRAPPHHPG
uniref:Uncharacterized protein n=1 Tax=Lygus hesperus TaxID=30085 RepID=A0A0K8S312_LYGHE